MMHKSLVGVTWVRALGLALAVSLLAMSGSLFAQGVTTGAMSGLVLDSKGAGLAGANVVAVHEPSGTKYGTAVRAGGAFNIPNMKIGGPYTVTASFVGYTTQKQENIFVSLGQDVRLSFKLAEEAIVLEGVQVTAEQDQVLNSDRTGAATYIQPTQVLQLPSVKRSTRDLTRLDPRNDGNFSFGGRNWLYNNISLDGSYFNNPFGLDDPAPGGQASAEPVPFDAVEQVQVSVVPFDVREGGFTGAGINTVTKSGTNDFKASAYRYLRNESLLGNKVRGDDVIANPDLSFNQSGITISGPLIRDKLFFFINGELERRDDPGSDFVANRDGTLSFGESRVRASAMDSIRAVMLREYNYDTGPYEGYVHETDNNKLLLKLDWNINDNHNLTFRYNLLDARREQGPHPFVLSFNNTGRGPNVSSLPFQNSGYEINNDLNSFAVEVNSRSNKLANRFFASYNRFRDFRDPFSRDFPTIQIGEAGVTYTTLGHEPFSIHNILDQDVLQLTNNLSLFSGKHVYTFGVNFEKFAFFNSFNIFRHGVFFLPDELDFLGATTFESLDEFFGRTNRNGPDGIPNSGDENQFYDFNSKIGTGSFKGEDIDVGQLAFYAQDEFLAADNFNLTYGLRVDLPMYLNDVVDNPFSRGLTALDENGDAETVDQSNLPDTKFLFSPRIGFNWDLSGDRSTQLRGGTGVFTGRVPFVWVGNNISNPGQNTNLPAHLRSFDVNAFDPDFKWPQVWTTNLAIDKKLFWDMLGTLEVIYGNDINAVFVRNADLRAPVRFLPDGRPYYGGTANFIDPQGNFVGVNVFELNPDGDAGIYVIDNTDEGRNFNATLQLRKNFNFGLNTTLAYSFTDAKNNLKSTEIASVLWAEQPVQGNPNKPELGFSEFGHRHRIVGGATYSKRWSNSLATHFGLFLEVAEGNRFAGAGGNRYSFRYAGDVNGDGRGGNDLIYIPRDVTNSAEIVFADIVDPNTSAVIKTVRQQQSEFEAFIRQDEYLSSHRGQIAERFGGVNPWYSNIDLRVLQDFSLNSGSQKHTFQLSFDILNVANLLNSDWGVRKVASPSATSPLKLVTDGLGNAVFNAQGLPVLNFTGPKETFVDDAGLFSRWQIQVGLKYFFD
jgi:hypothetical protein